MNAAKITILVDNRAADGLAVEHGLSIWLEAGDRRVLFDTGQGGAFAHNARALRIDTAAADILVISHGHYDHTGGVARVLRDSAQVHLYCHPGVTRRRYAVSDGRPRAIQMPARAGAAIDELPGERRHWVRQPLDIAEGLGLTGPIPRTVAWEDAGGPFFLDPQGRRPDAIEDDLALWVRTADGLVVVVGCCHAGLVSTLRYIRHLNDNAPVRAILGGFHLLGADHRRLQNTADALRSLEIEMVVPCHCTGESAVGFLRDALGNRVLPGAAGMKFDFEM